MSTIKDYSAAKRIFLEEIENYLKENNQSTFFKKDGLARAHALQTYLNNPQKNQNFHILVAFVALFYTSSTVLREKLVERLITENDEKNCESTVFEKTALDKMVTSHTGGAGRLTFSGVDDKVHMVSELLLGASVKCGLTIGVPEQTIKLDSPDVVAEREAVYKITDTTEPARLQTDFDAELTMLTDLMNPASTSKCVLL